MKANDGPLTHFTISKVQTLTKRAQTPSTKKKLDSINRSDAKEHSKSPQPPPIYNSRCKTVKTLCLWNTRTFPCKFILFIGSPMVEVLLSFFSGKSSTVNRDRVVVSGICPICRQLCYVLFP